MKKTLFFLGCLTLLAAGCNKIQEIPADDSSAVVPELKFDVTVKYDADTRSVKREWAEGDKIILVFDVSFNSEAPGYVTLTYDGTSFGSPELSNSAFQQNLLNSPTGKLAALYVSSGQTPQFQFEVQGSGYAFSLIDRNLLSGYILSQDEAGYTVSNYTVTANLDLTLNVSNERCPVHFFLPSISEENASNYTLSCAEFSRDVIFGFLILPEFSIGPQVMHGLTASSENPIRGSYYDGGIEFVAFLNPDNKGVESTYSLVITDNQGTPDDDSDDMVYTISKTATLNGKEAFNLPELTSTRWGTSNASGTRGTLNGHEWVLMADGKKWATMNVGANNETDGGVLSSWGDAQRLTDQRFGTGWRVPELMDWVNLLSSGYHTYKPVYVDDRVDEPDMFIGWEVTVSDRFELVTAGNRLFLPCYPCCYGNGMLALADGGYYWSTTLYDSTHPNVLHFDAEHQLGFIQDLDVTYRMVIRAIVDEPSSDGN